MLCKFASVLFLLIIFEFGSSLERGQSCITRTSKRGTCTYLFECVVAIHQRVQKVPRDLCKVGGSTEVVCCIEPTWIRPIPDTNPSSRAQTELRLAQEKCLEYTQLADRQPRIRMDIPSFSFMFSKSLVGGTLARPKIFPHMALLGYGRLDDIRWKCGGSVISRRFILTAAHCNSARSGTPKIIRIGDTNYDATDDGGDPQKYNVAKWIPHPSYRRGQNYYDIALIEVSVDMVFNHFARPACLKIKPTIPSQGLNIAGWGDTEFHGGSSSVLQWTTLSYFPYDQCVKHFERSLGLPQGLNDSQHLCAGSTFKRRDACYGDSGGPLQIVMTGFEYMYQIIGVTSFGKGCANVLGVPGVYTRVSTFVDWIESKAFVHG